MTLTDWTTLVLLFCIFGVAGPVGYIVYSIGKNTKK